MSLWSGSTDPKTLDYQRTNPTAAAVAKSLQSCLTLCNPRGSIKQWELTQRKPLEYKTWHHPTTSSTLCRIPHLNNKQNKNTNPIISRQDYHLTQPCPSEEKQTNKQKLSTNLTLNQTYINHWTNLRREESKRKEEFNLETWEKETSNTTS